jgi:hypothetical protein
MSSIKKLEKVLLVQLRPAPAAGLRLRRPAAVRYYVQSPIQKSKVVGGA